MARTTEPRPPPTDGGDPAGRGWHALLDPARQAPLARAGWILGVGVATLDLINEVASYPAEDEELRALAQRRVRGGNVTNSLVILAQLGHRCRWVGTVADDPAADSILADLAGHGISTQDVVRIPGGTTPTSYVTLSRANGSRTIVHYRDLAELDAEAFGRVSLADLAWVHFEGRNPTETRRMIQRIRTEAPHLPISLELEKPRECIDALLDGPNLLLASRAFALARGLPTPAAFLDDLARRTRADLCVVTWGAAGASYAQRGCSPEAVAPVIPERVIDTLGAGDVFNAGVIHGLLNGLSAAKSVAGAVELAGLKCGRMGLSLHG